jgi:flagellum-specific peptidoglycan hydrolase FlgJ
MTPSEFISKYSIAVVQAVIGTKLFPSVKRAQLALETGWGKSVKGNNMTGIKASSGWTGKVISFTTREVIGGVSKYFTGTNQVYNSMSAVPANADKQTLFRYYDSTTDSIKDHSLFLQQNARYANAGVFSATTPQAQADALQKAGYATDPNYAKTLKLLIKTYDLERLDQKKK